MAIPNNKRDRRTKAVRLDQTDLTDLPFGELSQLSCVYEYEKEYRVLLARRPDQEQLEAWKRGVILEDGYKTEPVNARFESAQGKGAWVRVPMKEGRKRQIR